MKRIMIYAVLLAMSVLALTGCKKKDEPAVQPETQMQTEERANTRRRSAQLLYRRMD